MNITDIIRSVCVSGCGHVGTVQFL